MKLCLLRILIGSLFFLTAQAKIADPVLFANAVSHYRLLPAGMVPIFALTVPWLEALAGLGLVLGLATQGSALALAILSSLFALATSSALLRNLDIACGCFRAGGSTISWLNPLFDLLLLLISLVFLRRGPGVWSLDVMWNLPQTDEPEARWGAEF